jgi:hypothetical protein
MATNNRRWLLSLLLLLCVGALVGVGTGAHAMIDDEEVTIASTDHFTVVWEFGFLRGGQIDLTIDMLHTPALDENNQTVQFMLCSQEEIDHLRYVRFSDVCREAEKSREFDIISCVWTKRVGKGLPTEDLRLSYAAETEDFYKLIQLNCHEREFQLRLRTAAVNPGGEYLGSGQIPYKTVYALTPVLWLLLLAGWVVHWWRYRLLNVRLHAVMTMFPASKLVFCLISMVHWQIASSNGTVQGEQLRVLGDVADEVVSLWCVMLLAQGYMFTRGALSVPEIKQLRIQLLTLGVMLLLYEFVSPIFFFGYFVVYVFALRFIFAGMVTQMQQLRDQCVMLEELHVEVKRSPANRKFRIIKHLQGNFVMYLVGYVTFHLWGMIFFADIPWTEDAFDQCWYAVMFLVLGFHYRMRPFDPSFFRLATRAHDEHSLCMLMQDPSFVGSSEPTVQPLITASGQPTQSRAQDVDPGSRRWHPGDPTPQRALDSHLWFQPVVDDSSAVILLENPDSRNAQGKIVRSLQIASMESHGRPKIYVGPAAVVAHPPALEEAKVTPQGAQVTEGAFASILRSGPTRNSGAAPNLQFSVRGSAASQHQIHSAV